MLGPSSSRRALEAPSPFDCRVQWRTVLAVPTGEQWSHRLRSTAEQLFEQFHSSLLVASSGFGRTHGEQNWGFRRRQPLRASSKTCTHKIRSARSTRSDTVGFCRCHQTFSPCFRIRYCIIFQKIDIVTIWHTLPFVMNATDGWIAW